MVNCTNYMRELFIIVQTFSSLGIIQYESYGLILWLSVSTSWSSRVSFFSSPILWSRWTGYHHHRQEQWAKFGQSSSHQSRNFKAFFFWQPPRTHCLNMTTSDLLLVSKYDGEFGTFFFFPNKPFVQTLSWLCTGVFFGHYCATIPRRRRRKKKTLLIITHCHRMWFFLSSSSSSSRPWLMTQVWL